jgi:hypothetical protein
MMPKRASVSLRSSLKFAVGKTLPDPCRTVANLHSAIHIKPMLDAAKHAPRGTVAAID